MRTPVLVFLSFFVGCSGALAADAVAPTPAPEIDPVRFGWTGFYVGASAGYGWLEDVDYAPPPGLPNPLYDQGEDWVFGGYGGYLYQWGDFVVGAELEQMRLDITYEGFDFITIDNATSVKGRLGYAFDRWLVTGHGGGVYATTNYLDLKDWGWTAGVGLDYAVTDNIVVGGQYTHYGFTGFDGTAIDADIDLLTARVGVKF